MFHEIPQHLCTVLTGGGITVVAAEEKLLELAENLRGEDEAHLFERQLRQRELEVVLAALVRRTGKQGGVG